MAAKLMKLELIYAFVGTRLIIRSIFFSMVLAFVPVLYIVQDAGPCDLSDDLKPSFSSGGLGFESRKISWPKQKAELYSAIYGDLTSQGLLRPGFKGLCVGPGAGFSSLAVQENGIVGIDRRSCVGRLPFADNAFDFVFTGSLDRAPAPAVLAVEIQRTLKPGGVAIILVSLRRMGKASNPMHFLNPVVALFRNADVVHVTRGMNSSAIALRKRPLFSKALERCSPAKQNRGLIELAEPLTENHTNAIFMPNVVDITARKRHVYIEIAANDNASIISRWFLAAYPKQNKGFKMYVLSLDISRVPANLSGVETVVVNQKGSDEGLEFGGWIRQNVVEEDFVVVVLGFEYARGMIESGGMCLIDELYLLCRSDNDAECMQLLHTLRVLGVFAHKW